MSFKSETYRVLIASPSDLAKSHSSNGSRQRVECPACRCRVGSNCQSNGKRTLKAKQSGVRPQEAINRQLVRGCDMLVGMFLDQNRHQHRGSPVSGTVEEIDQFEGAGKPAMLYFSSRPIDQTGST